MGKKIEHIKVHLEPRALRHFPAENCVDCGKSSRYWMADKLTPLCPECCLKRNQKLRAAAKS